MVFFFFYSNYLYSFSNFVDVVVEENTKVIQAEIDGNLNLNCGGISDDNDNNLSKYIEWKKDKVPITQTKNSNIIITASKGKM